MRKRRKYSPTGLYHVVIRGVNKQNIFYDDNDRLFFINLLKKYALKHEIGLYAYCLMNNHVHLEFSDPQKNISLFMQSLCSLYARQFNKKYDRIGHLFQERFASEVIMDKDYFLSVFNYIMQNPQKAKLSENCNYRWSSYEHYKKFNTFVKNDLFIEYLGSVDSIYSFIDKKTEVECLEIELRPSEREAKNICKIKKLLHTDNPIIYPDLPHEDLLPKLKTLKNAGISIRTISRITGIGKYLVQIA